MRPDPAGLLRLVAVAVLTAGGSGPAAAQPARPNIVWITTEDMSPRLGAYGDPLARTPNIDRLAREGVRFTHVFTTAGVCAPSRAALITGMYQTSIGAQHMRTTEPNLPTHQPYQAVPPPHVKAFTEYLRAAGYYATNNAKTDYQFAPAGDPRQPLTAWDESGPQAHWKHRAPGQPFFAVFNSMRTHESRVWPDEKEAPVLDPARVAVPPYYPDTPAVRRDLARHYDNIARMDAWVGGILEELEAAGLLDSTIVFFFSDHGDGLPRMKRELYDSGLHVPLIVRRPGLFAPGSTDDRLVTFLDLAPTVLALAGVPAPAHLQGRVFLGPRAAPPPEYVFAARDRMDETYDMQRAVRDRRFKYIRNFRPELPYVQSIEYRARMPTMQELLRLDRENRLEGPQRLWLAKTKPVEELYDTRADPHEIRNLAGDPAHREVLLRMRARLAEWQEETNDLGRIPEAEMVERMWPGGVQPVTAAPVISAAPAGGAAVEVTIRSETEGASIAYTTDPGPEPRWKLYTAPLRFDRPARLRARAVRYGYRESDLVETQLAGPR